MSKLACVTGRPDVINRFLNALISVAKEATDPEFGLQYSHTKCAYFPGSQVAVRYHQCSAPMFGRYVRITGLNQNNKLNLDEVEVHGWY